LLLGIITISLATTDAWSQQNSKTPPPKRTLNDVSLEIAALQTLHELELTRDQLNALGKLARDCAPEHQERQPPKASAECTKAMNALYAALSRGDDNQIGENREKLDAVMEREDPELDTAIAITDGARGSAADALKLLNVRQTGAFLSTLELTDPVEFMLMAAETIRSLKSSKEMQDEIARVAEEVVWLLHGDDDEAGKKTSDQVKALLAKAGKLKNDAAFASQKRNYEKEAKAIAGEVDNLTVISNILEHGMAELLSNPRLDAGIRIQTRVAAMPRSRSASNASKSKGKE
jgi:hypothetical protein